MLEEIWVKTFLNAQSTIDYQIKTKVKKIDSLMSHKFNTHSNTSISSIEKLIEVIENLESLKQLRHDMVRGIKKLDKNIKTILFYRHYKELAHKEIAEKLGLTMRQEYYAYKRGIAQLAVFLSHEGYTASNIVNSMGNDELINYCFSELPETEKILKEGD